MTAVEVTRWFLALYFLSVAGFYAARVVALTRGMRRSPVFAGRRGSLHCATHRAFRAFRAAILGVCLTRLLWPPVDRYLFPLDELWQPPILMLGNGLLLAGFATVLRVHFYMGRSWRSGARPDDETTLVTGGPFAVSRNPMMLGVMIAQLGLFLALPTLFTLVCLLVGFCAVVSQVFVEERVLQEKFGAAYEAYRAQTPRWLKLR
ncbi:MAG: isoprenylcysteine carboxylmethyltransferase family protein [Alphaproteobacteria bacterium]|nr:isoprenylcysteine carboxylmethyltransferase family protein [Alphaproteobacteria bacterium]